mmetsp:Transcript_53650/g.142986  ORF Transcript_53650/g.142986 Transcript_53650/m.142986 type:complete len:238 (+) Transcript_53650:711-1424(+)
MEKRQPKFGRQRLIAWKVGLSHLDGQRSWRCKDYVRQRGAMLRNNDTRMREQRDLVGNSLIFQRHHGRVPVVRQRNFKQAIVEALVQASTRTPRGWTLIVLEAFAPHGDDVPVLGWRHAGQAPGVVPELHEVFCGESSPLILPACAVAVPIDLPRRPGVLREGLEAAGDFDGKTQRLPQEEFEMRFQTPLRLARQRQMELVCSVPAWYLQTFAGRAVVAHEVQHSWSKIDQEVVVLP